MTSYRSYLFYDVTPCLFIAYLLPLITQIGQTFVFQCKRLKIMHGLLDHVFI